MDVGCNKIQALHRTIIERITDADRDGIPNYKMTMMSTPP